MKNTKVFLLCMISMFFSIEVNAQRKPPIITKAPKNQTFTTKSLKIIEDSDFVFEGKIYKAERRSIESDSLYDYIFSTIDIQHVYKGALKLGQAEMIHKVIKSSIQINSEAIRDKIHPKFARIFFCNKSDLQNSNEYQYQMEYPTSFGKLYQIKGPKKMHDNKILLSLTTNDKKSTIQRGYTGTEIIYYGLDNQKFQFLRDFELGLNKIKGLKKKMGS